MNGGLYRPSLAWSAVLALGLLGLAAIVVPMAQMPGLDEPFLLEPGRHPGEMLSLLELVLVAGVWAMLGTGLSAVGGGRTVDEVEERDGAWRVTLGWRGNWEPHVPMGLFFGVVGALMWLATFTVPELDVGRSLVGAGIIAALLGWVVRRERTRPRVDSLVIHDDTVEVAGERIPLEDITAVRWTGMFGHDRRIEREAGPSVEFSMRSNTDATRFALTRALVHGELDALHSSQEARAESPRKGRAAMYLLSWLVGFPPVVLGGTAGLLSVAVAPDITGYPHWAALSVVPALLFGMIAFRRAQPSLVRQPERVVFVNGGESGRVGVAQMAGLAWLAAQFVWFLGWGWMSVGPLGPIGLLVAASAWMLLLSRTVTRHRVKRVEIDAAGVAIDGREHVRLPWSEITGVEHVRGVLPSVVIETGEATRYTIPVGSAPDADVRELVRVLTERITRSDDPATAEEREAVRRAAKLADRSSS